MNGTENQPDEPMTRHAGDDAAAPALSASAPPHDPSAPAPAAPAAAAPPQQPIVNPGVYAPPPAPAVRVRDSRSKSPLLACILSLMPGLGQIYIGYYQRGFTHAGIVAIMITALATGDLDELTPLVAIGLAFFMLYNIIDAGRRAALYNQALAGQENIELPQDFKLPSFSGSIFGGAMLVGIGIILLMNTRFDISLAWIEDWWPMAPIIFGVYLIYKAIQERGGSAD